ncbi:MAG: hypothetical protein ACREKM_04820 [Longimicrobiales bacterium]
MCRIAAGLAALLLVAGCSFHHGPRGDTVGALIQPAGVTVELRLAGSPDEEQRELTGELLDVRDDGVLLLTDRILLIDYEAIERIRPLHYPLAPRIGWGATPGEAARTLQPVSRYPYGMADAVLVRMLRTLAQADVVRVDP